MHTTPIRLTFSGVKRGMWQLAPLAIFVIPFGMAYGIAAIERGMSSAQAIGSSVLVFSGAAQFAVLDLWDAEMSLLAVFLVTCAVGARHILMGAALSPWVNQLGPKRRVLAATFLSDPNFAHAHKALKEDERDIGILVGSGAIFWVAWILGTAIGAIGGAQVGDPSTYGIDVIMPVYFAALIAPGVIADRRWLFVVVAALVAILAQPIVPTGWNIIAAAIAGGLVGVRTIDE
ncbi:AzlC family ABC transporter permease [uncultured Roseobacter sp.]|uniref:AzlC family ABC transporter permease n=1 Tax=uncultured Roseobacter sp. TaxID=114847 RepID=UPI00261C6D52|nr:AzlC family ABC transporter permease [uncultured Roseobacter sp.]